MWKRRHYTSIRRFRRSTWREFVHWGPLKSVRRAIRRARKNPNIRATNEERRERLFVKYGEKGKSVYDTETDYSETSDDEMTCDDAEQIIHIHVPIYKNYYVLRDGNFQTEVIDKYFTFEKDMTYKIVLTLDEFIYDEHYEPGQFFSRKKRLFIQEGWRDEEFELNGRKFKVYVFYKRGETITELTPELLEKCGVSEVDIGKYLPKKDNNTPISFEMPWRNDIPKPLKLMEYHTGRSTSSSLEEINGMAWGNEMHF